MRYLPPFPFLSSPFPMLGIPLFEIDAQREYREIEAFYEEAARMLAWPDERLFGRARGVSGWSAAQHLEHLAKTNGRTFKGLRLLAAGKLPAEPGRPNGWGLLVLHLRRFPRGRVQAPDFARPADDLSREELERSLARNRDALAALAPYLSALSRLEGRMLHPRLGMLNATQWLRFVRVHSTHHLKIIREVTRQL